MNSSSLFRSLDGILGRVSHVRVLRALSLHGGALSPPELAWRTELSRAGVWNAITALEQLGVVGPVGTGTSVPFSLRDEHPLTPSIRGLFEQEAQRADAVLSEIRSAAAAIDPAPIGVWLFGSVARGEDRAESDVDIAVIGEDDETARRQAEQLRDGLEGRSQLLAVRPSVISLSRTGIRSLRADDSPFWHRITTDGVPLLGPAPEELEPTR